MVFGLVVWKEWAGTPSTKKYKLWALQKLLRIPIGKGETSERESDEISGEKTGMLIMMVMKM